MNLHTTVCAQILQKDARALPKLINQGSVTQAIFCAVCCVMLQRFSDAIWAVIFQKSQQIVANFAPKPHKFPAVYPFERHENNCVKKYYKIKRPSLGHTESTQDSTHREEKRSQLLYMWDTEV